jgi:hypothetical protein
LYQVGLNPDPMKILIRISFLVLFAGITWQGMFAQVNVLTSGTTTAGTGGTVSWSVGLVSNSFITGTGGTVYQGVEIPYEIYLVEGVEEPGFLKECTVYPNPATGKITLKMPEHRTDPVTCCLTDMEGCRLFTHDIDNEMTVIPMENLSSATYLLVIMKDNKPLKSFKIVKK